MAFDLIVVGVGSTGCVLPPTHRRGPPRPANRGGPGPPSEADLPADVADAPEPALDRHGGPERALPSSRRSSGGS
jgi:hypothetical protein